MAQHRSQGFYLHEYPGMILDRIKNPVNLILYKIKIHECIDCYWMLLDLCWVQFICALPPYRIEQLLPNQAILPNMCHYRIQVICSCQKETQQNVASVLGLLRLGCDSIETIAAKWQHVWTCRVLIP